MGGTDDHLHLLRSLPATIAVCKAIQELKAGSSKWIHQLTGRRLFAWQEGYGAFSLGISQVDDTISYIQSQAEHHCKRDFKHEFLAFLKKHSIEYDPRYIWD